MDDKLRSLLAELDEALHRSQADGEIDESERAELRDLVDRVDKALGASDDEQAGVAESLEAAAVRFEGRHPLVADVIRSAVDTLTGYGM